MNNSNTNEFPAALRLFTEKLGWKNADLNDLRQALIENGLIFEVGSEEFVSAPKLGEYVENELDRYTSNDAEPTYEDRVCYAKTSLSYLRSWFNYLTSFDFSNTTADTEDAVEANRLLLKAHLPYFHNIFKHLLNALEIAFGINAPGTKDVVLEEMELILKIPPGEDFDKKKFLEDDDPPALAIPLDAFNGLLQGGPEVKQRYQAMVEQDIIIEAKGNKWVLSLGFLTYVLNDLEHLRLRAGVLRSKKTLGDYTFLSFRYLSIWTMLLLYIVEYQFLNDDSLSDEYFERLWGNAIDCFRAIYSYTLDAIIIMADDGM